MSSAVYALLGVLIGALTTMLVEVVRSRAADTQARRTALRSAAAGFASTLAQMELLAWKVRDLEAGPEAVRRLEGLQAIARGQYETLRLLLESQAAQEAARLALRHIWSIWKQAETGVDPRAGEFIEDPWTRYHQQLRALLVAVRRELGLHQPEDVFTEPR